MLLSAQNEQFHAILCFALHFLLLLFPFCLCFFFFILLLLVVHLKLNEHKMTLNNEITINELNGNENDKRKKNRKEILSFFPP